MTTTHTPEKKDEKVQTKPQENGAKASEAAKAEPKKVDGRKERGPLQKLTRARAVQIMLRTLERVEAQEDRVKAVTALQALVS